MFSGQGVEASEPTDGRHITYAALQVQELAGAVTANTAHQ